jgi:hypothetical protein
MRKSGLAIASVLAVTIGCAKQDAAADATATKPQSAEEAATELCEAAGEVAADPATRNLSAWWGIADSRVTHPGVREVVAQLGKSGSANPAEPFFANMNDALGHAWDCPAAHTILGDAPR